MPNVTHTLCRQSVVNTVFMLAFSGLVHAGSLDNDLNHFFDSLGYNSNVTHPSAYKGQTARYYNAGSLYVRTPIRNAQLASVTLPSVSAGCNGIDAFTGGFSHISADALVEFGKAVVSSAAPFAVDLALQTWAPQLKQIRDNLQAIADKWLNQSINSCETAQAAIGGLAGFSNQATRKHVCATLGTHTGVFSDWVAAQHECGKEAVLDEQMVLAKAQPDLAEIARTSHNIVWSAMMMNAWLETDKDLAEFLMSLSGTFIYDANSHSTFYPSLLTDNSQLIDSLLNGGEMSVYQCDDQGNDKCLSPTQSDITLAVSSGLNSKVIQRLTALYELIYTDTGLDDASKAFLEYTKLPVLSILQTNVEAQQEPPLALLSEIVSAELLERYLNDMLKAVTVSLANTQNNKDDIGMILDSTYRASRYITQNKNDAINLLNSYENYLRNQRHLGEVVDTQLSQRTKDNYQFGRE